MTVPAGRLAAIERFPVKSVVGERLSEVEVGSRGLAGDRLWSVRDPDGKLGSGKTSRRFRRMDGLLELSATYAGEIPVITFPDGRVVHGPGPETDRALSDHVGRSVTLAREDSVSHFDEGPVHLVTTASLATVSRAHGRPVDWRRTRANLLVELDDEGFPEHGWLGRRLQVGGALVLRVRDVMPRCVMVNAAQDGLPADGGVLKSVTDLSDGALGVVADVERGGSVAVGDELRLT